MERVAGAAFSRPRGVQGPARFPMRSASSSKRLAFARMFRHHLGAPRPGKPGIEAVEIAWAFLLRPFFLGSKREPAISDSLPNCNSGAPRFAVPNAKRRRGNRLLSGGGGPTPEPAAATGPQRSSAFLRALLSRGARGLQATRLCR